MRKLNNYNHFCENCKQIYTTTKPKSGGYCSKECASALARARKYESLANDPHAVECLICNKKIGKLLIRHLKLDHNVSVEEYKQKYNTVIIAPVTSKKLSDANKGEKNCWHNHGGKISPFSKNNLKISEEIRQQNINKVKQSRIDNNTNVTTLSYWLNKFDGDLISAKKALRERQTTFSKSKCISKLGKNAGLKKWQERQDKWQNNLNSKSEEEKERILNAKINNGYSISKISQELFNKLNIPNARYGSAINGEKMIKIGTKRFLVDFSVENKIIEFFGDYWHANPTKYLETDIISRRSTRMLSKVKDIWHNDKQRISQLEELGYKVLVIWENDYRKDKEGIIKKCLNFLAS